jgi:hypothetical protein
MDRDKPLPPGRYYLQAIFYNAFIGKVGATGQVIRPDHAEVLKDSFDTTELFRSNIVEIELKPK